MSTRPRGIPTIYLPKNTDHLAITRYNHRQLFTARIVSFTLAFPSQTTWWLALGGGIIAATFGLSTACSKEIFNTTFNVQHVSFSGVAVQITATSIRAGGMRTTGEGLSQCKSDKSTVFATSRLRERVRPGFIRAKRSSRACLHAVLPQLD
jgi:hypothetical protein